MGTWSSWLESHTAGGSAFLSKVLGLSLGIFLCDTGGSHRRGMGLGHGAQEKGRDKQSFVSKIPSICHMRGSLRSPSVCGGTMTRAQP